MALKFIWTSQAVKGFNKVIDYLEIDQNNIGDIELKDKINNLILNHNSLGTFQGYNTKLRSAVINQSGIGDIYIFSSEKVSGSLNSIGNIYYKGRPIINITVTGLGKLINAN